MKWVAVAVAGVLLTAGCGSDNDPKPAAKGRCESDSGAEVCLVTANAKAHVFNIRATGFEPNSSLQQSLEGVDGEPLVLKTDGTGKYPPSGTGNGGVSGVVAGPGTNGPVKVVVDGTSKSGDAVHLAISVG